MASGALQNAVNQNHDRVLPLQLTRIFFVRQFAQARIFLTLLAPSLIFASRGPRRRPIFRAPFIATTLLPPTLMVPEEERVGLACMLQNLDLAVCSCSSAKECDVTLLRVESSLADEELFGGGIMFPADTSS